MTSRLPKRTERLYFAPGCALMLYKPELAEKILQFLNMNFRNVEMLLTCCQHDPKLPLNSKVINLCPGCDKRFGKNYYGVSTVSLWEVINDSSTFAFPDYNGSVMTIIDACPTRDDDRVQNALRELMIKMNVVIEEPANTRKESTCCGDVFHGSLPTDKVREIMVEKAQEMPVNEIVVHCVSCIMAVFNGGKSPKYMADLLFGENTQFNNIDLDIWHDRLREYIDNH
jgi:Fe-S oxidoreductase